MTTPLTTQVTTPDTLTRGQVIETLDGVVVFKPNGANYQIHLRASTPYDGPINQPISAVLRVNARKVYTVPSGGNFIQPIFGPPRIIQGRVKFANAKMLVVHAVANFVIELPPSDSAIDLNNGAITVGSLVNVVAQPGASIELVG